MCQADMRMHRGHVQALRRLALEQSDAGPVAAANRGITGELICGSISGPWRWTRASASGSGSWSSPSSWFGCYGAGRRA
eukprot:7514204-Pyramimonas_sp.AAC.1